MQQFYANGRAMPRKMDWKEERSLIAPSATGGTFPADTPLIRVRFSAFCKPFFRKCVHKLRIWGHLLRTRVPLLEKRDRFLKGGFPLLLNRCYSTQIGVPLLSFRDPLSAKRILFFRRCDYMLEKCVPFFAKCVPLLGKRDSILVRSGRTFITSERYLATCVTLSEKRDPILGERDYTFITSEQYFTIGDPLLVKCDRYFTICVPVSGKRTAVWQKRDIKISKRIHGKSISVPRKRKAVPKKALFCVISSQKSLQASDPITTQAQPKNDLRITQQRPKVDPSLTQETAKDDLSLTQPRPSLRTGYRQGSPNDGTTNTQETANSDTRNVRLMYRECTVSVRGVYRKGTGEVLKRYWRATKDSLNACTSGVDQRYGKSRRVVEPMRSKAIPLMAVWLCFMLFDLSDAWAQSAESRTAEGQTEIKPLKIGDTIPEELWHMPLQVVNHPDAKDTITLNDYRDKKLIILDFWSSWCSSCINSFPSLDSFQRQYANNLQILLINPASSKDDRTRILYIMEKRGGNDQKRFAVPSIYQDEVIVDYFQPKTYPRLIWINSTGVVLAITGKRDLNSENLQQLLKSEGGYNNGN
ncbi:redoxin domain-containing protein [Sphingobacterium sp. DN00404]|uniref:Redoxin domain-containing protein n=1 Tax=Sphingobacterium micropteri TaxID=2763501 RepID=A0ABR7YJW0_9SPHI|nr:thioredoxin-like domain-containing protein [Sphingobacterium micropteri]MBD1431606.1 redoxin domain-containing protein [Sphingobacterium micropteri]